LSAFGTDGVRGRVHQGPITPQWFLRLGFHGGRLAAEAGLEGPAVLGTDTRESSPWLGAAVSAGLASAGLEVRDIGVVPSPAVSYLVKVWGGALGVVITASHNPAHDNGAKLFGPGGGKLPEDLEGKIEARLERELSNEQAMIGDRAGCLLRRQDGWKRYLDDVVAAWRPRLSLTGLRIGVDAGNGAAWRTTPAALEALGAEVVPIHCRPDGRNINVRCGAVHPETLSALVQAEGLDLGITHDGDADRVLLVDDEGGILDGDDILYLLAAGAEEAPRHVVGTVMSNEGLVRGLRERGTDLLRSQVGDKHVTARMAEVGAPYGSEPSGHVIIDEWGPTGDGLVAALATLHAAGVPARRLSEARQGWIRMPQSLESVPVSWKPPLEDVDGYPGLVDQIERELEGRGRLLVRYSGTEPKVRVMAEAESADLADGAVSRLAEHLSAALGTGG
jgi:phosphoglucosamine mutase